MTDRLNCFILYDTEISRSYLLSSESEAEKCEWTTLIQTAMHDIQRKINNAADRPGQSDQPNAPIEHLEQNSAPVQQGPSAPPLISSPAAPPQLEIAEEGAAASLCRSLIECSVTNLNSSSPSSVGLLSKFKTLDFVTAHLKLVEFLTVSEADYYKFLECSQQNRLVTQERQECKVLEATLFHPLLQITLLFQKD